MSSSEPQSTPGQFVSNLLSFRYREVVMAFATLTVITSSIVLFPGVRNLGQGLQSDVSRGFLVFCLFVTIFAGMIKAMTGFGYAIVTTPIFASVIDPTRAVVGLAIPPWMLNMFQIGDEHGGRIRPRRAGPSRPGCRWHCARRWVPCGV